MRKKYKILTFFWAAVILLLSITPGNYIPPLDFYLLAPDTIVHFVFYFVLTTLVIKWKTPLKSTLPYVIIFLLSSLYGALIEGIQKYFIPGRFFDIYDIYVNSLGSLISALILFIRK